MSMTDSTLRIQEYLAAHEQKSLLRFITCGSVDDGKSTLIGRLLYESKLIFDDQLSALEADSARFGTQGGELDLALLVDGLSAEREQGITIDVAYRFFATDARKFIVADTPGHEQYTRNMVTGASTAELAVILIDARRGVLTQTRRHSFLVSLLGIRKIVLAINKMDLVGFSQLRADEIDADYRLFAAELGLTDITTVPMSAVRGDNVVSRSAEMPWYSGPSLLEHLDTVPVGTSATTADPFRLQVQLVSRPDHTFRGFAGSIVRGSVRPGDRLTVLPSGRPATVSRIVTFDGDLAEAVTGQSVTLTLTEEVDVSRGDVLAAATDPATVADRFSADVVWMSEHVMQPGRRYLVKLGTRTAGAVFSAPDYRVDVDTMAQLTATSLGLNDIAVCTLRLDRPVAYDSYRTNRHMGGFLILDRLTHDTLGAGLLRLALPTAEVHRQAVTVDRQARARLAGHRPAVVWFTGISGAGKSTVANLLEAKLHSRGCHTYLLDGDNVRLGLNRDLGFTEADRTENIRRVGEVAALLADAGTVVLVSTISPFRSGRDRARSLVGADEFVEVHVDTPLATAESRDSKSLYSKARRGELAHFTGIDSGYEPPLHPEVHLDTTALDAEQSAELVLAKLRDLGIVG